MRKVTSINPAFYFRWNVFYGKLCAMECWFMSVNQLFLFNPQFQITSWEIWELSLFYLLQTLHLYLFSSYRPQWFFIDISSCSATLFSLALAGSCTSKRDHTRHTTNWIERTMVKKMKKKKKKNSFRKKPLYQDRD